MLQTSKRDFSRIISVSVFAVAMGYLESAVVIYLREIYYPDGFAFPLTTMDADIAITEIFREFATLVMLGSLGYIAGRTWLERFGIFILAFGIWDIFYYIFLYILIGWPESLFTWDILFLIPTTWVGPVLAPAINALSMVIFGAMIWYFQSRGKLLPVRRWSWILLVVGSVIVIWAYIEDYVAYLHQYFSYSDIFFPGDLKSLMDAAMNYVPADFNWWIFGIGQLMILAGIASWVGSRR